MTYVVVKSNFDDAVSIISSKKFNDNSDLYEFIAGPMSYNEYEFYIESSKIVSGPAQTFNTDTDTDTDIDNG
ncbi:hypothetical protein [Vibrio alginolyticus]|uniref:hypothetical protein n=1 Tax=Vibrio alginolyticus TaxID=663 RepID=UPI003D7E25AA